LTEAFSLVANVGEKTGIAANKLLRVIGVIAGASGYRGMVGGQVIDMESENREVDLATLEYMHIRKTGALISASLESGAILGCGDSHQIAAMTRYGHHLGLAFQITDDLLDVEGDAQLMGKTPGSDAAKNKKTYPALLGVPQSKEAAAVQVLEAVEALDIFDDRAEPLRAIAHYLLVRKG
jgi:geranylgeranyl diphosphate synthase, type II